MSKHISSNNNPYFGIYVVYMKPANCIIYFKRIIYHPIFLIYRCWYVQQHISSNNNNPYQRGNNKKMFRYLGSLCKALEKSDKKRQQNLII